MTIGEIAEAVGGRGGDGGAGDEREAEGQEGRAVHVFVFLSAGREIDSTEPPPTHVPNS